MRHIAVLIIFVVFLSSCKKGEQNTWNYRVTVEIETPEGIKSGSAVRQVSTRRPSLTYQESGNPSKIVGEAVVVDLGERGVVFAILSDQSRANALYSAFFPSDNSLPRTEIKVGNRAELKENLPNMVMFEELNDPKSVKLVFQDPTWWQPKPEDYVDKYEKIFGKGVRLKSIIVEVTDDPITLSVEKTLPWLGGIKSNIDGTTATTSNNLHNKLHKGNFKKGLD